MRPSITSLILFLALGVGLLSCEDAAVGDSETTNRNIFRNPDYEDSADGDGVDWEDQSARSEYTDKTSDPREDPLKDGPQADWVTPRYTDDEYEAAYSTSSTDPKNQIHKLRD